MKKSLANEKGFTMIEMLIALMILSMIVALLVGLIGNPIAESSIKQSASKIGDDLRAIDDAAQQLLTMTTIEATGLIYGDDGDATTDATAVVGRGYLKAVPSPPPQAFPAGIEANDTYRFVKTYSVWADSAVADTAVMLPGSGTGTISDNVCRKINEIFAADKADASIPGTPRAVRDLQCFGPGGDKNFAIKPIYVH